MQEPTPRTSRLAIAGSLAALLAAGGAGFFLGRGEERPPPPASPSPAPPVVAISPTAPPPTRDLDRGDLIALGNAAADALASGDPLPDLVKTAPGKRFDLSLPFGCDGPSAQGSGAPLRWRYDEEAEALRVHVEATDWPIADWWRTPPPGVEALEGFWIRQPWSTRGTCTAGETSSAPGADPITLPGQTLGIVQVVTEQTPRQMVRGGKPYETVTRVAPNALRIESGLRVRLRGRLATFPDGGATRCTQRGGRDQRPTCLIAVSLDEVAIENPATQDVLASWAPTIGDARESAN